MRLSQIVVATPLGTALAWLLGWTVGAGLVFGVALSVASTVVVLRSLQERRLLDTERGHIAVGWLVVEDLAMVLVLVFLPALADLAKGAAVEWKARCAPACDHARQVRCLRGADVAGRSPRDSRGCCITSRIPARASCSASPCWRSRSGSPTGPRRLFDVSFALGAFFAGMILSESALSQRAAQETLPLRDAFAVLFFVSVGMLFNPSVILSHPIALVATLIIITVGKSAIAYLVMRLSRHPKSSALMIAASRAQIGEFSFILAGLGVALGVLPPLGRDLVLAAALISILLTPFLFVGADWIYAHQEPPKKARRSARDARAGAADPEPVRSRLSPIMWCWSATGASAALSARR